MKTIAILMAVGCFMSLLSCGHLNEKKQANVINADTLQTTINKKEQEHLEKRKKIEAEYLADSLRLDQILREALKVASQNIDKKRFIKQYEVFRDSILVKVDLNLDYHFTKVTPHLIIRRNESDAIYIDIYSKDGNKFEKVIAHEQWTVTYENDTIKDINGDGLNDFIVNWYGSNGCCLKAFSNIYLLRKDKNSFSENFEFINPTFSPKEQLVRGISYGHPGQTAMYKYKWNGERVDTIEYVSYLENDKGIKTGKVVISTYMPYDDKFQILKVLNSVPPEYRKIENYNWFTGDL